MDNVFIGNDGRYYYYRDGKYYFKTANGEIDSLDKKQIKSKKVKNAPIPWSGKISDIKFATQQEKEYYDINNSDLLTDSEKNEEIQKKVDKQKDEADLEAKKAELKKAGLTDEQINSLSPEEIINNPAQKIYNFLNGDPEGAYKDLKNTPVEFTDYSANAETEAQKAVKDLIEVSNKADEEEFSNVENMLEEEGNNLDITTPEGRKDAEEYINTYKEMIENSEAYKKLMGADKKNRILTALSGGISAAFGVPALDFTDSADIKEAQAQLKEIHSYFNDQKNKQKDLETKKREAFIEKEKKKADNAKLASKQKAEYATNKANTIGTTSALTEGQLQDEYYKDLNTLKKGTKEINSEVGKQRNKRNEMAITHNLAQNAPLLFNKGVDLFGKGFDLIGSFASKGGK